MGGHFRSGIQLYNTSMVTPGAWLVVARDENTVCFCFKSSNVFKMSGTSMQSFRSFLTEHFTTLAADVFGEVERIVEACYEENKQLRSMLHMVLSPQINLARIDISQYTVPTTMDPEQPPEANTRLNSGVSEPLTQEPKEEMVECSISWRSEEQQLPEVDNFNIQVCVKSEPEEEEENMPYITDSQSAQCNLESPAFSSATLSNDEERSEQGDFSPMESEEDSAYSPLHESEKLQPSLQKTMLQIPRMRVNDYNVNVAPAHPRQFVARLQETFKDFPDEQKPLITTMGLTADVDWVDSAFGKVPKGSILSYQCPVPSSSDFKPHEDTPPQPQLPVSHHKLEPASIFPHLSAQEQGHINAMSVTWEDAHSLEESTRGCKESVEKLRKLRLTSRFREICTRKAGQSHAEKLLLKLQKGGRRNKMTQIDEETKPEALREYCRHLCVNWSPCGLVVHPDAPWLGAVPDGLVYDPKETKSFGLVHIECVNFQSFSECKFLACRDGFLQLKLTHPHYWDIQGEMLVTGTSWCDLLVHSRKDILVQRIYRNETIIQNMKKKLDEFFFYYYLPNLILNE
ncbi:uncharacterized protein LOC133449482 [Cololabis saira]|uniref:uncharacterized protein LOC133449482 n=1 Tax=Cololabis saira TaxID=129043 RepID=UPI002AD5038E|nr:uncharacterized protein LOC133449482 [Cololabis saira]